MSRFRVVRGLLIGLAAVVAFVMLASIGVRLAGALRLRAASAKFEREMGPLSLLGFVKPKLPPEANAVTWLKPGVLAVVLFREERGTVGSLAAKPSREWTAADFETFQPLVDRNAPALAILGRARVLRASNWDIPYEEGNKAKLPDLLAALDAGKFVAARGHVALAQGDRQTALECVEILGSLASSHEQENALILLLIGSALERMQLALVQDVVTGPGVSTVELDRIERSLSEVDLASAFRHSTRSAAAALVHDIRAEDYKEFVPRLVPRSLSTGFADLIVASVLDECRRLDPTMYGPVTAPLPDLQAKYNDGSWWDGLVAAYQTNSSSSVARGIGTASARQLAKLTIGVRREALTSGAYPLHPVLPVDPLSGQPFAFDAGPGGVTLRSTTKTEIVTSIFPVNTPLNAQLFSWTLPPSSSRPTTPSPSPAGRKAASS